MLDGILEAIEKWMREILSGMVLSNLATMYADVNEKTGSIAAEVGKTPQAWNGSIFSMIRNLSDSVMLPIASMVITFVLCYELVTMLTEKNSMHDIDTWMFFKYFVKMWVAVYVVSHTFDIVMAVFDVGQHIVNGAAGVITGDMAVNIERMLEKMTTAMEDMEIGELIVLTLETFIVSFCLKILSVLITVILYVRMVEIYLYISVSPVTFATFGNREWGQIGNNYVRGLLALAFQGFFIMVCVGIYAVLVSTMDDDVERKGIGTPATRADVIEKLVKDGYVTRDKKKLKATPRGVSLVSILPNELKSAELTADWENKLTKIAKGEADASGFMDEISDMVKNLVQTHSKPLADKKDLFQKHSLGVCPKCKKNIIVGKYGAYCEGKCGVNVSFAFGKKLSEKEIDSLLAGKRTLVRNLKSKKDTTYDAYLTVTGTEDYSYKAKDGTEKQGTRLTFSVEFPKQRKKQKNKEK